MAGKGSAVSEERVKGSASYLKKCMANSRTQACSQNTPSLFSHDHQADAHVKYSEKNLGVILFPRHSIVLSWTVRKCMIAMLGTEFVSSEKEMRSN